jgi:hypothetical protein
MAARYKQFQRDADLYPNLRWTESTSVVKREPHVKLYGLILPIAHPFWQIQYPGSLWNCKCGITNTDEAPNGKLFNIGDDIPEPPAGLDGNPAFTGKIFSLKHPYVTNAYGGKKLAELVKSFVNKVMLAYAEQALKTFRSTLPGHNGVIITNSALQSGSLVVLRRSISDVREHNAGYEKLLYIPKISDEIKGWKYIGYKPVDTYPQGHTFAGKTKHPEAELFTYYEAEIAGRKAYVNVKLHRHYKREVLYCITDYLPKGVIKKPIKK